MEIWIELYKFLCMQSSTGQQQISQLTLIIDNLIMQIFWNNKK